MKPIGPRRGMVMPLHLPMIAISSQKSMQTTPRMPQATPLCCSFTNVLDLSGRTIIRVCPFALLEWSDSQYICGLACLECAGRWWSWWWCWPCIVWRMGQRPAFEPSSMPLFARSWLKGGNNDIKSSPERGTKSTGDSLSRLNSIRNASITLRASIIRNFAGMVWWQTVTHASVTGTIIIGRLRRRSFPYDNRTMNELGSNIIIISYQYLTSILPVFYQYLTSILPVSYQYLSSVS